MRAQGAAPRASDSRAAGSNGNSASLHASPAARLSGLRGSLKTIIVAGGIWGVIGPRLTARLLELLRLRHA